MSNREYSGTIHWIDRRKGYGYIKTEATGAVHVKFLLEDAPGLVVGSPVKFRKVVEDYLERAVEIRGG